MNVLLVEDDEGVRGFLEEVFQTRGHAVTACADAESAWERCQQDHFPFAVLDWMLPGMDGLELCRRIRSLPNGHRTVIYLITARQQARDLEDALEAGVDDYIIKPIFELDLLHARIAIAEWKVQDLAGRKFMDETLQTQTHVLQSMIEGVAVVDADKNIIFTNPAFNTLFGYESGELLGESVRVLKNASPDQFHVMPEGLAEMIRNDRHGTSEVENKKKDGSVVVAQVHISTLSMDNRKYWIVVCQDITEKKQHEELLRELPKRIMDAQESERRRVARELHDGVSQVLASVKFRIQMIERKITHADNVVVQEIARTKELLDETTQDIWRICQALRPSVLDDVGLAAAIRSVVDDFQERTRVETSLTCPESSMLPSEIELALFRIVQETLTNIEKHAKASELHLKLTCGNGHAILCIQDNGIGFDPQKLGSNRSQRKGLGLYHMKERASYINGMFTIRSVLGEGTRITIQVPFGKGEQDECSSREDQDTAC